MNGESLHGLSHEEAIGMFKRIRSGPVVVRVARRGLLAAAASAHQARSKSVVAASDTAGQRDNLSSAGGSANDGSSNGSGSRSG